MTLRFLLALGLLVSLPVLAQEIEPRRWTPLPLGTQVVGVGYGHSFGDVAFDPALQIEGAQAQINTVGASYVVPFNAFGKLARFDTLLPYQTGRWEGLLQGNPASTERSGLGDPQFRLSLNIAGTPAMDGATMRKHLATQPVNTQVGIALAVSVPLGQYDKTRLLNLGRNRYTVQPQFGILHNRGLWSYELTGSAFVFTDNKAFYNGNTFSQKTLLGLQAHIIRRFNTGHWLSASYGQGLGGESSVNGVASDDDTENRAYALSLGIPLAKKQSIKVVFIHSETHRYTGADLQTVALAWSILY